MQESYSVDDILRLTDGLRERGVSAFRGCGLEINLGPAPKKRDIMAGKRPKVRNAVDLALELSGKADE